MHSDSHLKIAFLSTYPPRECGIATFTQDLVRELKQIDALTVGVVAVSDNHYRYDENVLYDFDQQNRENYLETAMKINNSDLDLLVVEHEFGIYGGDCGEFLLDLADHVNKPIVSTLHTVLPTPNDKQKSVLKALCQKSEKIVTMAKASRQILTDVYGVDSAKIEVIHHGVPDLDIPDRDTLKKEMNLEKRTVISTFGLISPGKGLEYGIEAVNQTAKKHPEVLYFVLGQTHPVVRRQFGEAYRQSLEKMVRDRNLQNNVTFVNKYLTKEEIIRYLKLSDIYMTPYLGKDQAVSGTLAYAVGYGRVIVSTPYIYAKEMLGDGRGLLGEFRDADSLGRSLNFLIEHPEEKDKMEKRTQMLGNSMRWNHVAECYRRTFFEAVHHYSGTLEQMIK